MTSTSGRRRFHYLISATFTLNGAVANTAISVHMEVPIATTNDIETACGGVINFLAQKNPAWDRQFRGWRDTVAVTAFSMMRAEVEQRGRWVLADWQPWGPLNAA